MTTSKPKILGYCAKKDRGPWKRSNEYYLSPNPDENYTVPVISLSDYEALQAECDALRDKTGLSLGVGDGTGNLFVHGDYDSIKRVQELIFECEKLRRDALALVEALEHISGGCQRRDMPSEADIAEWAERIDAALADYRKGGEV